MAVKLIKKQNVNQTIRKYLPNISRQKLSAIEYQELCSYTKSILYLEEIDNEQFLSKLQHKAYQLSTTDKVLTFETFKQLMDDCNISFSDYSKASGIRLETVKRWYEKDTIPKKIRSSVLYLWKDEVKGTYQIPVVQQYVSIDDRCYTLHENNRIGKKPKNVSQYFFDERKVKSTDSFGVVHIT